MELFGRAYVVYYIMRDENKLICAFNMFKSGLIGNHE